MPLARLAHVFPKSLVTKTYGLKSSLRWPSNVRYAVPSATCDASRRLTQVPFGTPGTFARTLAQVAPPSRVICTFPSSVPTQMMPGRMGDSAIVMIVQWVSAPVSSIVMPPVAFMLPPCRGPSLSLSLVVRSGLMICQWSPRSTDLNR